MIREDKVALITGAAGQLGKAVARHLRTQGFHVALLARRMDQLQSAFRPGAAGQSFLVADLSDPKQVQGAVGELLDDRGRIDVLCNLAGGFRMGDAVHTTQDDTWQAMLDTNARSILNMARCVVPVMRNSKRGKIVNIGSRTSGAALMGAYAASKSAVVSLTESMAAELGPLGIHVNCVLPSIIDTPANRMASPNADWSAWLRPEAVAKVIGFLASDDSHAINGAAIPLANRPRN
jgi:NAD(P)-dependent dehydrogenase (short-subunit alcohol dehydrogenase family)